jgi:hypothetical protein
MGGGRRVKDEERCAMQNNYTKDVPGENRFDP